VTLAFVRPRVKVDVSALTSTTRPTHSEADEFIAQGAHQANKHPPANGVDPGSLDDFDDGSLRGLVRDIIATHAAYWITYAAIDTGGNLQDLGAYLDARKDELESRIDNALGALAPTKESERASRRSDNPSGERY